MDKYNTDHRILALEQRVAELELAIQDMESLLARLKEELGRED